MNLASIILNHARNRPRRVAIECSGRQLTYAQLGRQIESCASRLAAAGARAGDRIGLCLGDNAAHLVMHFAVPLLGATILPIDHRWTPAEKAAVAAAFGARLVVRLADEPDVDGVVNIVPDACWFDQSGEEQPVAAIAAADDMPLLISLSSGTTGRPKGAIVSHRQMYERFINQWITLGIGATDRFVSVTPLYFGAARSFCMGFLVAGATVIFDPPPHKPPQLVAAIRAARPTVTFMVPALLHRLLPLADQNEALFPELRALIFGGSIVHAAEALEMQRRICPKLISYYATSEGGGVSVLHSDQFAGHGDTVGQPAFRVDVDVTDSAGVPVARGEVGRLCYRGPGVATAFLDEDGKLDRSVGDGWFYPGDLAVIDAEGFISLRGREKEMIIRGGINVYPAEIESVLRQYPQVTEAAVIGWPAPGIGEEVAAFVTGATGIDPDELLAYCRQRLAPYKLPKQIFVLDELPKTSFGKIRKSLLTDRLPPS